MTHLSWLRLRQSGFTLIEIAIVLLIVGLMLGSIMGPLSKQRENTKIRSTEALLTESRDALLGFASLNGYLPCPALANSNGLESRTAGVGTDCSVEHGFLPSNTLGLSGVFSRNGVLADEWSGSIRYSLSNAGSWSYAKEITLQPVTVNFEICNEAACGVGSVLASDIVATLYSLGPNQDASPSSLDQIENLDSDKQFVKRIPTEGVGTEFDDIIIWISPNILALNLVKSGQLNNY